MLNAAKLGESRWESATASESVVYKLRDFNQDMVAAWEDSFAGHQDSVEVSLGDIFKRGPAADAIVSPANSFGFMDGGIDMYYSIHFGWQLQDRLKDIINKEKDGELLVGDAVILRSYENADAEKRIVERETDVDLSLFNEGKPIKYLISAPTMRVPQDVDDTVNAYLAFRAVILAVKRHNRDNPQTPIRSVLCPGLGTAVGRMLETQCARQMLLAYETFALGLHKHRRHPKSLNYMYKDEDTMKDAQQDKGGINTAPGKQSRR